jgi:hypothetical protein
MLRKLLHFILICLATQIASAKEPGDYDVIIEDPEPNWNAVAYKCPISIKTEMGENQLESYSAYSSILGDIWGQLKPEARKNIQFNFTPPDEQAYVFCRYKGIDTEFIIHAKDAVACGRNGSCWKTDPYAGIKQK